MKHIAAFAIALTICSATTATSGGLTDPVLEQEIIIEAAKAGSSVSGPTFVALFSLLIVAGALAK